MARDGDEESGGVPAGSRTPSGILIRCSTLEKWFKRLRGRQGSTGTSCWTIYAHYIHGSVVQLSYIRFYLNNILVLLRKPHLKVRQIYTKSNRNFVVLVVVRSEGVTPNFTFDGFFILHMTFLLKYLWLRCDKRKRKPIAYQTVAPKQTSLSSERRIYIKNKHARTK